MRTFLISTVLLLTFLAVPGLFADTGSTAPEPVEFVRGMRLIDIDGDLHRVGLEDGTRGTVLVLLEPDCPIAGRYAPDLNALFDHALERGLGFYAVVSDPLVTPEQMRTMRDDSGLRYPILVDSTGDLALRLGPKAVPEAFLIDGQDRVAYRGRIDNRFVSVGRLRQQITEHDLREAIDAVAAGEPVGVAETQPVGCVFEAWDDTLPEEITYTQHIQPLLSANCVECHTAGGIAPFALDSYRTASRRARMMGVVAADGVMPPWQAEPSYRRFRDERTISGRQIAMLRRWAESGKAMGDEAFALPEREITRGWPLGEPDAVVTMEEPYGLPASGDDQYRRFVMKSPFAEPVTVVAVGFKPGDPRVVHHANIFYDATGAARKRDAAEPGPGYDAFGKQGGMESTLEWDTEGTGIGGWAPGADGYRLPADTGMRLPPGGDIMVEIHYHLSGRETTDQSSIAFYLADEPVEHFVDGLIMGSLDVNIAPGDSDYLRHIYMDVPVDMQLVDMFPHMHYLGTEMWAEATTPDGDTIPLVHIPDWDFRWQNFYQFPEPQTIPAGSRIDAWFRYDNSADNPDNPTIPPKPVKWGWQSTDEMLEIWMTTIYTGPRDSRRLQRASLGSFYRNAAPKKAAATATPTRVSLRD